MCSFDRTVCAVKLLNCTLVAINIEHTCWIVDDPSHWMMSYFDGTDKLRSYCTFKASPSLPNGGSSWFISWIVHGHNFLLALLCSLLFVGILLDVTPYCKIVVLIKVFGSKKKKPVSQTQMLSQSLTHAITSLKHLYYLIPVPTDIVCMNVSCAFC